MFCLPILYGNRFIKANLNYIFIGIFIIQHIIMNFNCFRGVSRLIANCQVTKNDKKSFIWN